MHLKRKTINSRIYHLDFILHVEEYLKIKEENTHCYYLFHMEFFPVTANETFLSAKYKISLKFVYVQHNLQLSNEFQKVLWFHGSGIRKT
jgi:hypothetical protein